MWFKKKEVEKEVAATNYYNESVIFLIDFLSSHYKGTQLSDNVRTEDTRIIINDICVFYFGHYYRTETLIYDRTSNNSYHYINAPRHIKNAIYKLIPLMKEYERKEKEDGDRIAKEKSDIALNALRSFTAE